MAQAQAGDATGIIAAIVYVLCGGRGRTVGIQLDGYILANGHWGNIVFYGNGSGTGTAIAVDIGNGQGDGVSVAYVVAIEAGIVQAQAGDATGIVAAIVYIVGGDATGSVRVELDGDILAQGDRIDIVFNRYHR